MNTQTQNNGSQLLKGIFTLLIISVITFGNALATNGEDKKETKKENKEALAEAKMIDELLESLETEAFEISTVNAENAFQVFDQNDNILFSGTEKQWKDANNKKLITLKRKAEFLFESNGSKIYKVF